VLDWVVEVDGSITSDNLDDLDEVVAARRCSCVMAADAN
jgi:hypothetical protein